MNNKRLAMAIIAAYVAMSILGILSDIIFADQMTSMKLLGRMGADLDAHIMWMYLGYFLVTIIFCIIYAHNHEGKGWQEGARFGLLIGIMMVGVIMVNYGTIPFDGRETILASVITVIIYVVGGIVTSLVYKKE